jgi:hypothetical protein
LKLTHTSISQNVHVILTIASEEAGQVRLYQHSQEIPTLVSGPGTLELEVGKHTVTAAVKRTSVPLSTRNTFSVADDARHTCTGCVCRRISLGTNISSVQVTVRNHGATAVDA